MGGIRAVLAAFYRCLGFTFTFGEFHFSLGAVIIGSMIISLSAALINYIIKK